MRMKQRAILNRLFLDFARDGQDREAYLDAKIAQIKAASREYIGLAGQKGYILGLSGGIDSFVSAALLADALRESGGVVHLLLMPNGTQSDFADAEECRDALTARFDNIIAETVSIENAFAGVFRDLEASGLYDASDEYAKGNTQARLRMVEQYALGRGLLVAGTDHATENVTGYFTKYGDGGTDFNPMDGLLKDDIYAIAERYGAPECVMKKAPAAGLGISGSDEEELGVTYAELCSYLRGNLIEREKMQRIAGLFERAEHKRHLQASPMNLWWKDQEEDITHVVVDIIHAFVDGSMACTGGPQAAAGAAAYIDAHPQMRVLYVRDAHPEDHSSFEAQGGPWPQHAVAGMRDDAFVDDFYALKKTINTPIARYNVFDKGTDPAKEEYSGFGAMNAQYGALKFNLTRRVVLSGIATEYCVKNTAFDLLRNGFEVSILREGLAYIDENDHLETLAELEAMGAKLI